MEIYAETLPKNNSGDHQKKLPMPPPNSQQSNQNELDSLVSVVAEENANALDVELLQSAVQQEQQSWTTVDLTLDEKITLLSGDSLWTTPGLPERNIPGLRLNDGPHGVRKPKTNISALDAEPATCFPTECCLACSFDEDLLVEIGMALNKEAQLNGVNVLLGPGINLKRHPCA